MLQEVLRATLPVKTPDQSVLNDPPADKIQYMWIGHASVLYQMGGWNLLSGKNYYSHWTFLFYWIDMLDRLIVYTYTFFSVDCIDDFSVDPIWSERCSPFFFIGPKRYRQPPLTIEELPQIDAVVISHNHYDHLDKATVTQLNQRFGDSLQWVRLVELILR